MRTRPKWRRRRLLTSHWLGAVHKNVLGAAAEEAPPPQVEVVDVAPLVGGQLRGKRTSNVAYLKKKEKKESGGGVVVAQHISALLLEIIMGSLSAYKQGFKIIAIKTSLQSAGLSPAVTSRGR